MPKRATLLLAAAATLAMAGCHLVDQRDFSSTAGQRPAPPQIAAPPKAATPTLVTIRYTTPDPPYREALTGAVQRALARRSDVLFTVTTLVPGAPSPDTVASGRDVAQTIVDAGAALGQVEQAVREQPGLTVKEIRVTVH